MDIWGAVMGQIARRIAHGKSVCLTDRTFLEREIAAWKGGPVRGMQIQGFRYCDGDHDILRCKRTVIGEDGDLREVENLPNNRIVDNQYGKLVAQKTNYLLGQPLVVECENGQYAALLKKVFDKRFMSTLKNAGKAALCGGIAWLYPYYNSEGEFCFRLFPAYEILPFWRDSEHTELDCAVRLYEVQGYDGFTPVTVEKAEVYAADGVHCFLYEGGRLLPDPDAAGDGGCAYVTSGDTALNWQRVPLVAVKYNETETPLLKRVKTLQDGLNTMLSDFENRMQEDPRNTVLVVKNYDGTNLGEFRANLAQYGAVKVCTADGIEGDVTALEINVSSENYKAILDLYKKAIIENGMGFDAKDDRLSGNPNQMNIQSMYSDIDLDANDMETELQAAFDNLLWFVNAHLANTGQGDFAGDDVTITFNRDMLMNETEAIANCAASAGLLSEETIVAQHPWVDDPQAELERLKRQREEERQQEYDPFAAAEGTDNEKQ